MCAYYIPDSVRHAVERLLQNGVTSTPAIAGQLHKHEFAVQIDHRLGVIDQIKEEYREEHSDELYEVEDKPLSDDALETALETAS